MCLRVHAGEREGSVRGTELSAASESWADVWCGHGLRLPAPRTLRACVPTGDSPVLASPEAFP